MTAPRGPARGRRWLKDFLGNCTGCHIDAVDVSFHECDGSTDAGAANAASATVAFIDAIHEHFGKPVWLMSFNCGEGDAQGEPSEVRLPSHHLRYMKAVLPMLEANPNVERYSWLQRRQTTGRARPVVGHPGSALVIRGQPGLTDLGESYASFASAVVPVHDPRPNQQNLSEAVLDYVATLTATVLIPKYCNASNPNVHWDTEHADVWAFCAAVQSRLWVYGGRQDHGLAEGSKKCFMRLVAQANSTKVVSFFTNYPMMLAYADLYDGGSLSPSETAATEAMVIKTFQPQPPESNNQHYQRAAGLVLAARIFPHVASANEWLSYGSAVMKIVTDAGDITENAPNYNRIDAVFLWILGDLLHQSSALRSPSYLAMWLRFARQISPSGAIPSYGDSGGANALEADAGFTGPAPWANAWDGFVAGFVRAASECKDEHGGPLAAAAAKMFSAGRRLQPLGSVYGDVGAAFRLLFAVPWAASPAMPQANNSGLARLLEGGAVLTRQDAHGPLTPDKVVLRGEAASAFVLSDLYSIQVPVPPHAHENQHGQVNWYEAYGYPLASSLGYDNRGPADSNLLLVRPASDSFPHAIPKFPKSKWLTATVPTSRMVPATGNGNVTLKRLTLRIEYDGSPIIFSVAQFRLAGSLQDADHVIEVFNNASAWEVSDKVFAVSTNDTNGNPAIEFRLPSGRSGQAGAQMLSICLPDVIVDTKRFSTIRCEWKISSNADVTRTFIIRLATDSMAQIDFHASELNFAPRLLPGTPLLETSKDSTDPAAVQDSKTLLGFAYPDPPFRPPVRRLHTQRQF